ncbi:MAG TPA: hypothetical protein VHY91_08085 [Pirellulales bacterium]|jgi:hypothetical protein|nr:hypothetical protein [Pirellulales bacterium]
MAVSSGKLLATGMLGLGLAAAVLSIAYRRGQTQRALALWGPEQAATLATAPVVKALRFDPPLQPSSVTTVGDVVGRASSQSPNLGGTPGFATVRQLLVADTSFDWQSNPAAEPAAWTLGLEFSDPTHPTVVVLLDPSTRLVRDAETHRTARLTSGAAEQLKTFLEGQFAGLGTDMPAK